jgi:hypothetical protein
LPRSAPSCVSRRRRAYGTVNTHCGEPNELEVDTSAGDEQEDYKDCWVCCRAMTVRVTCRPGRLLSASTPNKLDP